MLGRAATFFYGAALVTLPWVGAGLLKLTTGRDWGGGLQPSWFFLALAIICLGLDRATKGSAASDLRAVVPPALRRWWFLGACAVFLAVMMSLGGLWLAPPGEAIGETFPRFVKQLVQLFVMVCFAVWPALWTRGSGKWSWTVKWLLIGGIIQVGYGFVQGIDYYYPLKGYAWLDGVFTSNPSIFSGSGELYLGDAFRHVPRLRGTACEPLYLGNYLLFLLPLTLVPGWPVRTRRLAAGAFLVLLMWTWSRGAWLGLAGQVVLAGVLVLGAGSGAAWKRFGPGSRSLKIWGLGAAVLCVAVPLVGLVSGWDVLLFPYRRLVQTFSSQDWSNLTRLYSMQAAWRAFLLSPWVGIGWGQFGWHFPALVDPMGLQSQFTWPVVNNFPLLVLCETGLVGFLVFCSWAAGLVRAVTRRWAHLNRTPDAGDSWSPSWLILFGTSLAVVGVWSQMLTFSQYNLPHIWVALGLLLAAVADGDGTAGGADP